MSGVLPLNNNVKNEIKEQDISNAINSGDNIKPKTSAIVDKVYTFTNSPHEESIELELDKHYIYYIYIELVTPHNVSTMRIRIWDPDGKQYNVFQSEMFFYPEFGRYFEIPFGTAISSTDQKKYDFKFYAIFNYNFNLHIQITKGPKCLYDKIDPQETNNIIKDGYDVRNFTNGRTINVNELDLKKDMSYKFYIGRVSAITIEENNEVRMDFSIEDPDGTEFVIYNNEKMENIDGMNIFPFGIATEGGGEYNFDLTIDCSVEFVNIAYAIVEDYQIAEGVEGEDEEEKVITLEDIAEDIKESAAALPNEWMIGSLLFIGVIVGFSLILLVNQKKMNTVALNIKEK